MHPRRTTFLLLSLLLTAGCVAVPHPPSPRPQPAPEGPAPAADRPPSPIPVPAWPVPAQPVPHEEIADTDPLPGTPTGKPRTRPVTEGVADAAEVPAARRSPGRRTEAPPPHRGASAPRTSEKRTSGKTRARTDPRAVAPSRRGTTHPEAPAAVRAGARPATEGTPAMRGLCRQAEDIDAPMGAADLCRGMYPR
ncbi:hypothetical protein [Streptomyces sp. NBC_00691]|uniref:hypothetical protein n=1 Tax=Streptomyces sp. NBC_00691 TaxID=2903671 RepID=UPI002E34D1A4|nr:hypothetical protein [Streptomyces sp. NBC_00691]